MTVNLTQVHVSSLVRSSLSWFIEPMSEVKRWYSANLWRQAYCRNRAASSARAKNTIDSARNMRGRKKGAKIAIQTQNQHQRTSKSPKTKRPAAEKKNAQKHPLNHQPVYVWNGHLYGYPHPPRDAAINTHPHPSRGWPSARSSPTRNHSTEDSYELLCREFQC